MADTRQIAEAKMLKLLEECEILINGTRYDGSLPPRRPGIAVSSPPTPTEDAPRGDSLIRSVRSVPSSPRSNKSTNLSFNYMLASIEKQKLTLPKPTSSSSASQHRMYRSMDSKLISSSVNNNNAVYGNKLYGSTHNMDWNWANEKLVEAERNLNKELLNKTRLESRVVDLMSEAEQLKCQLAEAQSQRDTYKERYNALQNEVIKLSDNLALKESEIKDLRCQLNNNHKNSLLSSNGHHPPSSTDEECTALKKTVADLLAENDEKDLRIEELRKAVSTYQKVEEIILNSAGSRSNRPKSEDATTYNSTSLVTPAKDSRKFSVSSRTKAFSPYLTANGAPPVPLHGIPASSSVNVPRSSSYDASKFNRIIANENETEEGDVEDDDVAMPLTSAVSSTQSEWSSDTKPKGSCASLPRDYGNRIDTSVFLSPEKQKGPRLSSSAGGDHLNSEVFITEEEEVIKEHKKRRGLRRLFAKMKRSTSQEAVGGDKAFKRGGVRATAGARFAGNQKRRNRDQTPKSDAFLIPFARWTTDQVATWLYDLGLSAYIGDCKRWCRSGQHMMEASKNEIDKELHIQHPLHRKKLHLALDSVKVGNRKEQFMLGGLNSDWISKWLDDIGLPQYKDQFAEACIDGRMLNQLTVDDLLYMKINNALHHLSIGRGIEVLRTHNFNLGTLKRRPSAERSSEFLSSTLNGSCRRESSERDVSLWTNHRLMEWLRMIDLSEYAANLRGSGVHGGLIMLEPRFTVEHLADILVIPTSKTLLRRHLSAHFVNLVGQKVQARKREAEQAPGMTLTLNLKVKAKKTNIFKRGRPVSVYVCPMEKSESPETPSKGGDRRVKSAVAQYKKELNKRDSNNKKDTKSKTSTST